jgi:hypothetical protein
MSTDIICPDCDARYSVVDKLAARVVMLLVLAVTCATNSYADDKGRKLLVLTGKAEQFKFRRDYAGYYWREDFSFKIKDEKTQKTWNVISREPTPVQEYRCSTTYPGLKPDWSKTPRVKVVGVSGIDRIPVKFYGQKPNPEITMTAMILFVETGKKKELKEFYVNNWFHHWGQKADVNILKYYADKGKPYNVYGFVGGIAAPFDKGSQKIIDSHQGKKIYHALVRKTDKNLVGYELKIVNLLVRDKQNSYIVRYGSKDNLVRLDSKR